MDDPFTRTLDIIAGYVFLSIWHITRNSLGVGNRTVANSESGFCSAIARGGTSRKLTPWTPTTIHCWINSCIFFIFIVFSIQCIYSRVQLYKALCNSIIVMNFTRIRPDSSKEKNSLETSMIAYFSVFYNVSRKDQLFHICIRYVFFNQLYYISSTFNLTWTWSYWHWRMNIN